MFQWGNCVDGSAINMTKLEGLVIGSQPKIGEDGKPIQGANGPIIDGYIVFGIIGPREYPMACVQSENAARQIIMQIVMDMKQVYDKANNKIVEPTAEETRLALGN